MLRIVTYEIAVRCIKVLRKLYIPIRNAVANIPGRQIDSERLPDILPARMVDRNIATRCHLAHETNRFRIAREFTAATILTC